MSLRLYRSFLRLFPARHRHIFGHEMSAVFQQRRAELGKQGMYYRSVFFLREFMSLVSTAIRERARHSELHAAGVARGTLDSVPAFYTCESYFPRRSALLHGGILSLAVFGAASAAFEYGVSHRLFRVSLSSSQAANQVEFIETGESGFVAFGRSLVASAGGVLTLILGAQPAAAAIEMKPGLEKPGGFWSNLLWLLRARPHLRSGEFQVQGFTRNAPEESRRDYAPVYFQLMPVLRALDADGDYIISAAEIASAPTALQSLDRNHDGKLSPEECGQSFAGTSTNAEFMKRARLEFMHFHPVLAALDTDHDGEISASEIQNAATALKTLDKNGEGKLTQDDLLPIP